MFTFEYSYPDFKQLLDALASKMNTQLKDNWLFFPKEYADGYMRQLQLPNGLDVSIINCRNNTEWLFYRKKSKEEYYTLRFDAINVSSALQIGIGKEVLKKQSQQVAVAYLTSSLFDWYIRPQKGTRIKGVQIIIPKDWLGKFLGIEVFDQILPAYIGLKSRSFNMAPIDQYYMELIDEIMVEEADSPFPKLYVLNRIQLLMERFFNQIHAKVSLADVDTKFKTVDIKTVISVEQDAMKDFSAKPPSIDALAKKAAMSTTKFKNLFKTIYGTAVYEYYQQRRMEYAARLLAEGDVTVKEVSAKTGYSNLGNFSAAFKKQFQVPPQEYLHKN